MFGGGSLEDQTKDDLGSIAIEIHCVEECLAFEQICMAGFEVLSILKMCSRAPSIRTSSKVSKSGPQGQQSSFVKKLASRVHRTIICGLQHLCVFWVGNICLEWRAWDVESSIDSGLVLASS